MYQDRWQLRFIKPNNFCILSSNRRSEFKFDQFVKSGPGSQTSSVGSPSFSSHTETEVSRFLHQNMNLIFVNLTEDCQERIPSELPDFPRLFYSKWMESQKSDQDEDQDAFDIKVSFLLIRESERVDLIIEYFNEKLKNMNSDRPADSKGVGHGVEGGISSVHNASDEFARSNRDIEKDFVFNFRTFKEVFPFISSVSISDHTTIDEAYREWIKSVIENQKAKARFLSNILIVQFHKTSNNNRVPGEDMSSDHREYDNFFTYIHIPFIDKNINPDISTMAEIIGRAMEKKSETKIFDCLFRKSALLMRLQDFMFPAYPSQRDFLATQTKLQVTLFQNPDLK